MIDAIVGNYSYIRKNCKCTTKAFMHFLEQAVFNSYVIHENLGGKKRFLWYKPADKQVTLNHQRIEEN